MMRTLRRVLLTVALSAGLVGAVAGPASAVETYTTFRAAHSAKCLDVTGYSTSNNAKIQQFTCHGETNQLFADIHATGEWFQLKNLRSQKCLDIKDKRVDSDAPIQQYTCQNATNQHWRLDDLGGGSYRIVSRHTGMCLTVQGGGLQNNRAVVQAWCTGVPNQVWSRWT